MHSYFSEVQSLFFSLKIFNKENFDMSIFNKSKIANVPDYTTI